jgi:PAS domain S-box-containing protein
LDQALQSQEVANFELALFTKRGERRDILLNATPRWDSQGVVIGVVGVGQDITALNKQRAEVERIADDLSRLIDTANAPIFGSDTDGNINEWNRWVATCTGLPKDKVMGLPLCDYIEGRSFELFEKVLDDAKGGIESSKFDMQFLTSSGGQVMLLLNATPRRGQDEDIVGVICVGQDITHIRDMEEKKSRFLATITHELKSPLHGIIGLSDSLGVSSDVSEAVRKPLGMIKSCASRLLDMVTNMMDASVLVRDKKMRLSVDM